MAGPAAAASASIAKPALTAEGFLRVNERRESFTEDHVSDDKAAGDSGAAAKTSSWAVAASTRPDAKPSATDGSDRHVAVPVSNDRRFERPFCVDPRFGPNDPRARPERGPRRPCGRVAAAAPRPPRERSTRRSRPDAFHWRPTSRVAFPGFKTAWPTTISSAVRALAVSAASARAAPSRTGCPSTVKRIWTRPPADQTRCSGASYSACSPSE